MNQFHGFMDLQEIQLSQKIPNEIKIIKYFYCSQFSSLKYFRFFPTWKSIFANQFFGFLYWIPHLCNKIHFVGVYSEFTDSFQIYLWLKNFTIWLDERNTWVRATIKGSLACYLPMINVSMQKIFHWLEKSQTWHTIDRGFLLPLIYEHLSTG